MPCHCKIALVKLSRQNKVRDISDPSCKGAQETLSPILFTNEKQQHIHFFHEKHIQGLNSRRLGSNNSFLPVFIFRNTVSYPSTCLRLMLELSHVSMRTQRRTRAVRRCVFPAVSAVLDTLRLLFAPWPPLQQRRDDLYLRFRSFPLPCTWSWFVWNSHYEDCIEFIIASAKSFLNTWGVRYSHTQTLIV